MTFLHDGVTEIAAGFPVEARRALRRHRLRGRLDEHRQGCEEPRQREEILRLGADAGGAEDRRRPQELPDAVEQGDAGAAGRAEPGRTSSSSTTTSRKYGSAAERKRILEKWDREVYSMLPRELTWRIPTGRRRALRVPAALSRPPPARWRCDFWRQPRRAHGRAQGAAGLRHPRRPRGRDVHPRRDRARRSRATASSARRPPSSFAGDARAAVDRRSDRRHAQLPARHPVLERVDRLRRARRAHAGRGVRPGAATSSSTRGAAAARGGGRSAAARAARPRLPGDRAASAATPRSRPAGATRRPTSASPPAPSTTARRVIAVGTTTARPTIATSRSAAS